MDRKSILQLVATYAVLAASWILFSDTILYGLWPQAASIYRIGLLKGLAFVGVTALILWWLLRRIRRIEADRYRAIFENHHAVMLLIDPANGDIVDANPAAAEYYGWSREQLSTMRISDIDTLSKKTKIDAAMEHARKLESTKFHFRHRLANGAVRDVEVSSGPTTMRGKQLLYSIIHDVTERDRAEAQLRRQRNLYAALAEINHAVVQLPGEREIFDQVCRTAVQRGGFLFAWICSIDAMTLTVTPVARYGEDKGYLDAARMSIDATLPIGRGPIGMAVRENRSIIFNDFLNADATRPWHGPAQRAGVLASGAFPIRRRGKVVALLNVYATSPGYFDDEIASTLDTLTVEVSFALDNADRVRQQAETMSALAKTEERFRQIAENISEVFWLTDPVKKSMLYVSPAYEEIWRRSCQSLYDTPWSWVEAIHPEDRERVLEAARTKQARGDYAEEYRIRRPDGAIRWIRDEAFPVRDQSGAVIRIAGVAEDITVRRLATEALEYTNLVLATQQETSLDGILVVDVQQKIVACNQRFSELWGIPREVLESRSDEQALQCVLDKLEAPDEFLDRVKHLYEHRELRSSEEIRLRDGRVLERYSAPMIGADGNYHGRVWYFRDITDRQRAAQALRDSEQRYRSMIEQTVSGFYLIQDGVLVYVNTRLAEIFGYASPGEVIGRSPMDLVAKQDHALVTENIRRRLDGEIRSVSYEFTGLRKDGTRFTVGTHGSLATHDRRPAIIGLLQDVTEKARAEKTIRDYVSRLERAMLGTVDAVSKMVELRDPYTSGHEQRVGELAAAIAEEMGLDRNMQQGLRIAGGVHDIGKIVVPAEILAKPGRLNAIEYEMVKGHAQQGYEVLKSIDFPWPVAEVARQHHERIDGSGYPRGLKGDEILLEARILAVADVVESMASHRPYRPGLGIAKALQEIESGADKLYDPQAAAACLRLFREKDYALPE